MKLSPPRSKEREQRSRRLLERRASQRLGYALVLFPAVVCLVYILAFTVDVPFWDQWRFVPLFDKLYQGTLTFGDLYAPHNEHRILFPKIAMLALGALTKYNVRVESVVSWFLLCGIGLLLFITLARALENNRSAIVRFVPVSFFLFMLRQTDNLLWGWQIAIFMTILLFLMAMYLIERSRGTSWLFLAAIVSAVMASFSFGNGLLVWPVGIAQMAIQLHLAHERHDSIFWRRIAIWSIVGILTCAAYLIGFAGLIRGHNLFYFVHQPLHATEYYLTFLGSPIANELFTAMGAGLFIAGLYVAVVVGALKRLLRPYASVWLSLIFFTVGPGVILVIGRASLGAGQSLAARYTTFALLGICGVYLAIVTQPWSARAAAALGCIVTLMTLGVLTSISQGWFQAKAWSAQMHEYRSLLQSYETEPDSELSKLHPVASEVRDGARILQKHRLSVFR